MQQKVSEIEPVDKLTERCRQFMSDWAFFGQLLGKYPATPPEQRAQLEMQFLQLKSKLAREHEVLKNHLGPDFTYDGNTVNIIAGSTNLESIYAQSDVSVKKLQNEWHRAFISMNETQGVVDEKRARIMNGEQIMLGNMLVKLRKPIPWKKIFMGTGIAAAVVTVALTLYVMRTFLGFWAPEAGAGIEVTAEMNDEQRIQALLSMMISTFDRRDIDKMMSAYADNFQDDEGRGKTELRVFLQAAQKAGQLEGVGIDISRAVTNIQGDYASMGPIIIILPDDDPLQLTFVAARYGDRWLINNVTGF